MALNKYIEKYKNLQSSQNPIYDLDSDLCKACEDGDLEAVIFLLTSSELPSHANILYQQGQPLSLACKFGHLEIAKYLCTSSDLQEKITEEFHVIHALKNAASFGHLEIIKFFLNSNNLTTEKKLNIFKNGGELLLSAVRGRKNDIVEYLLSSEELESHVDVHYDRDMVFRYSIVNKDSHLLSFLIFDMNLNKTKDIEEFLSNRTIDYTYEVEQMFKIREIKHNLDNELNENGNHNKKKSKI
jgi:ankyrin repeat protein